MSVEVFCSYAHEDVAWLDKLETHLSLLKRQGLLSPWHDRLIVPGTNWAQAIDTRLETASVILLLISEHFFASDYCVGIEMKRALERQEEGSAVVIPILISEVNWRNTPFMHLQALPINARPLTTWPDEAMALLDIAAGIQRAVEALLADGSPRAAFPLVQNIPYPRNLLFLGRKSELAQVRSHLQRDQTITLSQPQAISGLGGIGKTQLALEYVYHYRHNYQAVLWAQADTRETLTASYLTIATLLNLTQKDAQESVHVITAVKEWLYTSRGWLLILDNADDLELARDFLPPCSVRGHVLLTTRAQAMGRFARRIEVDILPAEEGTLFLLRRAGLLAPHAKLSQVGQQEQDIARSIYTELGGLPLALDQAGAYIEETGCSLASYQRLYKDRRADLLAERRGRSVDDHPLPVATTWSLSFQKVEQASPTAADLLRLCAFLAPDAIPETIITKGARHLGANLASVGADPYLLNKAIGVLRNYSLLSRDAGSLLSVHRLVQAVFKDQMNTQTRRQWVERAVQAVSEACPDVHEVREWDACERWLPHALICAEWVEQEKIVSREAANMLLQIGRYMHERGKYSEVEQWYLQSLEIRKSILGPAHLDVADVLCRLANLYSERGKYAEAEQLYQESLGIREPLLGPDDLDVASILNNLAILRKVGGKYEEAERLYKRNLDIRERSQGPEHLEVAQALNNLGVLYAEYGNYEDAEPLFRRSLRIRQRQLAPEHPDIAQSAGNLANLLTTRGNYEEAESLYQRGLMILERRQGHEHPYVAYVLNGLAILCMKQGRYSEAEEGFLRSKNIWKQYLDPQHPQIAYAINNLALLAKVQGKYEEAEQLYQESLDIFEQRLGPGHPHTRTCAIQFADTLTTLAQFLQTQDAYEEATIKHQQRLRILARQGLSEL